MSQGTSTELRTLFAELLTENIDPIPANGGKGRSINGLAWSPGLGNESFDVYFGDDFDDVLNGVGGTFQGNQTPATFSLPLLPGGGVRYWRIANLGFQTLLDGTVWSFAVRRQNQVI